MTWLNLNQKIILVTGGKSGIGATLKASLEKEKAIVLSLDKAYTKQTESEFPCDITNQKEVEACIHSIIQQYGHIDGLVNNAGMSLPRLLIDVKDPYSKFEMNESFFDQIFSINVKGTFFCTQAVSRYMVKQKKGVIVNVSSECGKEGSFAQSAYSATKAAIESFTRSWAKELGPYNIRTVAIAPGPIEATNLWSEAYKEGMKYCRHTTLEEVRASYKTASLLQREGKLIEIADTILFLLSDHASYITGTTINVSGGKSRG